MIILAAVFWAWVYLFGPDLSSIDWKWLMIGIFIAYCFMESKESKA